MSAANWVSWPEPPDSSNRPISVSKGPAKPTGCVPDAPNAAAISAEYQTTKAFEMG